MMARRVVDLLKIVEVDEDDAKAGAGERSPFARVVQPVEEVRARRGADVGPLSGSSGGSAEPPSACASDVFDRGFPVR